jgi:beta-mannosidase
MLNDPAPAVSWSVVDWKHRPKAAYRVLAAAMSPVLVCAQYPGECYAAGTAFSLPLFVVNDFARDLGRLDWTWELYLDGAGVARGSGETEIPADSVTRVGEARARLPEAGRATLVLRLSGEGVDETNTYDFIVTDRRRGRSNQAR